MNWKGYIFCAIMMVVAALAWLRPTLPAAAADPPRKFEYKLLANTDPTTTLTQLNGAGAQGWRAVGYICAGGSAGNGGFGCNAETLLMRELH